MAFLDDLLMTGSREGGGAGLPPGLPSAVRDIAGGGGGSTPQRRPKPTYRPLEREKLILLSEALDNGMDPSIAAQFLGEITGGLDERQDIWQQKNAQRKAMAMESMQNLPALAGQATELFTAGVPQESLEAIFSGQRGRAGNRLDEFVGGLYQGGSGTTGALDPDTAANITAHASDLAAAEVPLHDARITIMTGMRNTMGTTPAELEAAYNMIGSIYETAAPNPGAEGFDPGSRAAFLNAPLSYGSLGQAPPPPVPPVMPSAPSLAPSGPSMEYLQEVLRGLPSPTSSWPGRT